MDTNRRLFGTDGIRGRVNEWPMTPEFVLKIGRALARILSHKKVFIGKDTRESGDLFEAALASGLASEGIEVLLTGIIPTPGIAYLTRKFKPGVGVIISASHNPYQDNGLKFFGPDGFKFPDSTEAEIEEILFSKEDLDQRTARIGRIQKYEEAKEEYLEFLKGTSSIDLKGLKVVVDCANGALSGIIPVVLEKLGVETIPIHIDPDGRNINLGCGSCHPEVVAKVVMEKGADAGFAFDGDGDRVIAIDEKGNLLDGDQIMAILAKFLKEKGELKKDLVVTTVMSNLGLELFLKQIGVRMVRTKVGDRYVVEEMQRQGAVLGGEQSGHIIFSENTTGDGAFTALRILSIMASSKKTLSELAKIMEPLPQISLNIKVKDKPALEDIDQIQKAIAEARDELGESGRVLVRYSGTEPVCRVMVEGPTKEKVSSIAYRIREVIEKEIGMRDNERV